MVTCPVSVEYTGVAQTPCTVSVTGANLSLTPAAVHANNTDAGTASASYTYPGDANHTGSSDSKTFQITEAAPDCTVEGVTVTYDGDAHGASGSCLGVQGETLDGLDLGASFTNVPGGTATWTFTDVTGNYTDDSGHGRDRHRRPPPRRPWSPARPASSTRAWPRPRARSA